MNRGAPPECAAAAEIFNHFCAAATMRQVLALHRELNKTLSLRPHRIPEYYPKLKAKLASSWKAQALFKKFDARANHKVYAKGRACTANKALIIGAGPCGLRAAIELQLLGAKVVVIEKRDRMTRNNVLHLWPFVIHDLRALGAKKFFGKFCAGSIDHISIRQLQCILLKVALLLGVELHEGVGFEELIEPSIQNKSEVLGWKARVSPASHPVSEYEFDVLIGADGKRNTLPGFTRKEFRGKLAMAITANFINRHSEQEASVPEISGVAFIFNQKFFKELYKETGIDLENIVYYKDETHYFVMTAKKASLIEKGVILNDASEVSRLLSVDNVDREALMKYAQEAARFSTDGQLPLRDFALNHYGEPDIALFDFTSMYAAENASVVFERHGRRLLCQLVGDSLLEPFWPTGSGCARGFLSALDAAWAVRAWGQSPALHPLDVIAERESIYRLLAQTTPENLHRNFGAYTMDPGTRYPNLNRHAVTPHRVTGYYKSDDPLPLDATASARKRRREPEVSDAALVAWVGAGDIHSAVTAPALAEAVRRYRPDLVPEGTAPRTIYSILQNELGIAPISPSGTLPDVPDAKLRSYLSRVYNAFKGDVPYVHHETNAMDEIKRIQREKDALNPVNQPLSAYTAAAEADKSSPSTHKRKRRSARTPPEEGRLVGGGARSGARGARVAKLAAELSGSTSQSSPKSNKPKDLLRSVGKIEADDWNVREIEKKIHENKLGRPEPRTAERVPKWDREQFLGRQRKLKEGEGGDEKWGEIDETLHKVDQKLRDSGRPDHGTQKVAELATKFVAEPAEKKNDPKVKRSNSWRGPATAGVQCAACGKRVFAAEGVTADGLTLHRACFRCAICKAVLRPGNYTMERYGSRLVCLRHSRMSMVDGIGAVPTAARQVAGAPVPTATPERISLELSDSGAREIDEDEFTDRNFLASETSCAGGLSDEEESSSEEYTDAGDSNNEGRASPAPPLGTPHHHKQIIYISDDSFGYDDYSDDGAESSGNESCSRMREAREARRREVPADARPSSYSSEVESEESESSEDVSSDTEVSTDSEFAREETAPPPPCILVTEAPSATPAQPSALQDYPLNRTRSAGGLATKRALELKRKYLLGEASPPAVRKSDSASQIDSKFEAFRSNITEFQKMLNPAATSAQPPSPVVAFQSTAADKKSQPMPDIIRNLCTDAPVDLLAKTDSSLLTYISEKSEPVSEEKPKETEVDLDSDSLSEDESSHTETGPQNVPRVEVHDEGGELVQLDSLMMVTSSTEEEHASAAGPGAAAAGPGPGSGSLTGPTVLAAADDDSSESGRDATTLALTETELSSDWAAENALDDHSYCDKQERKRNKNPRTLSQPKLVHDAKNIAAHVSHVCGRTSPPEHIGFSNALEHFEFADEGDQDPSIETPSTPKNEGYMELVDDFEYSPGNDRSMNFIERSFSETVIKPPAYESNVEIVHTIPKEIEDTYTDSEVQSPRGIETESSEKSVSENKLNDTKISDENTESKHGSNGFEHSIESLSITEVSPQSKSQPLFGKTSTTASETGDDVSPPLLADTPTPTSKSNSILSSAPSSGVSMRLYSPAICRSASDSFNRSTSRTTDSPSHFDLSVSVYLSSGSVSPVTPSRDTTDKVQEIKRERDEQTEVVRRLVLERLGSSGRAAGGRRRRARPVPAAPPPVPPPPALPEPPPPPPPPPRPAPPLIPMPVTPSFSDPELARERRRKSIMKSISNYLNRHLGPRQKWASEPILTSHEPHPRAVSNAHKSMGELQEPAPPVPPPPACYCPPTKTRSPPSRCISPPSALSGSAGDEERDAMQLWFEARWARLVAQRRAREDSSREEPAARRLARLERRLTRPLSAEEQAATVAELVQVSAQRDAHLALKNADRRRSEASNGD